MPNWQILDADVRAAALKEIDDVIERMFAEDSWPPERLAARLIRLQAIARIALEDQP